MCLKKENNITFQTEMCQKIRHVCHVDEFCMFFTQFASDKFVTTSVTTDPCVKRHKCAALTCLCVFYCLLGPVMVKAQ